MVSSSQAGASPTDCRRGSLGINLHVESAVLEIVHLVGRQFDRAADGAARLFGDRQIEDRGPANGFGRAVNLREGGGRAQFLEGSGDGEFVSGEHCRERTGAGNGGEHGDVDRHRGEPRLERFAALGASRISAGQQHGPQQYQAESSLFRCSLHDPATPRSCHSQTHSAKAGLRRSGSAADVIYTSRSRHTIPLSRPQGPAPLDELWIPACAPRSARAEGMTRATPRRRAGCRGNS
jgi:hypothetical protein